MSSTDKQTHALGAIRLIVGSLTGIALLLSSYSAASRYLFPSLAQGWVDEMVIYIIVWAMWLSGSLLVSENTHVQADVTKLFLSPAWSTRLTAAIAAIGFAFCCLMTYGGAMVVLLAIRLGEYSDSTIALPLWWYYIGFPIGMILMAWRYALALIRSGDRHE